MKWNYSHNILQLFFVIKKNLIENQQFCWTKLRIHWEYDEYKQSWVSKKKLVHNFYLLICDT